MFRGQLEQADIVVAIAGIGRDKQMLAVGRKVFRGEELLTLVRRQQRAFAGRHLGNKNIGICSLGLLLRVHNPLPISGPDGIYVHLVFGRARGQVFGIAHQRVKDVDLVHRRRLGFHRVGEIAAVRRPCGAFFRDLARVGDVDHLPRLRRDEKNVPLLITVIVGLVGDPLAVGGPCGRGLALVADRELRGPAPFSRHQPEIKPAADVGDESDGLAVRRPGRCAHRAGHI